MSELSIRVEGDDAEAFAREVEAAFHEAFGEELARQAESVGGDEPVRGEGLQIAQFLLTFPISLLATFTLADRLRLKPKVDRFLARVREKRGKEQRATLQLKSGKQVALNEAETGHVMELWSNAVREQNDQAEAQRDTDDQGGAERR